MKIVSWNIEGRLSNLATDDRGTPEKIIAAIKSFDADIIVHPEAWSGTLGLAPGCDEALAAMGYTKTFVDYDDKYARDWIPVPRPQLCILTRLNIIGHDTIRPGGLRSLPVVTIEDPQSGRALRIIGVHLEDRSETYRLQQVGPLIEYINDSPLPTVVMGDFNAMPPSTTRSHLIHSGLFKTLIRCIPHKHMQYTLQRLSDMASGTTIGAIMKQTNLRNTDPKLQLTTTPKMKGMQWLPAWRFAKIDWMFVSPDIEYKNYSISPDLGSDHRALSLEILLKNE